MSKIKQLLVIGVLDSMVDATTPRIETTLSKTDGIWIMLKGANPGQTPPE